MTAREMISSVKLGIRKGRCRYHLDEHIDRCERYQVRHQRQIADFFDRAVAQLRQNPLIFSPSLLFGGVRRPVDAQIREVVERNGDGATELIEFIIHIDEQARDLRSL